MPADDPTDIDLYAGLTKGTLDWTKDRILGLLERFRNRSLAFIEDRETIDFVREQRRSTEWKILSDYVKDRKLRIIALMGLTLRKLETDKEMVKRVRGSIHRVFGIEGLHIAEAVQNEVLSTFIGIDSPLIQTPADLTNRIEKMLKEVDKYIIFISAEDDVDRKIREIRTRIDANIPDTIILYGCFDARKSVRSIATRLEKIFNTYDFTFCESKIKTIVIVTKLT